MRDINVILFKLFQSITFDFTQFKSDKKQRIIYQKYGLLFKYLFKTSVGRYGLYLNGPYNTSLASLGYEICDDLGYYNNEADNFELPNRWEDMTLTLFNNFNFDANLLELFSTYIYLLRENNLAEEEAVNLLIKIKSSIITEENCINNIQTIHNNLRAQIPEYNSIFT